MLRYTFIGLMKMIVALKLDVEMTWSCHLEKI